MAWTVRDLMQTKVLTADPQMRVTDLERRLVEKRVSGLPVVSKGRLLGIVSLSDIVRRLCVEQSIGEVVADYYRDFGSGTSSATTAIGSHVGGRIENLRVQDVMTSAVITVSGDTPVTEVAQTLVKYKIHRVPVVKGERIMGIISSLDLVRFLGCDRPAVAPPLHSHEEAGYCDRSALPAA